MEQIRILHEVAMMDPGGVESLIMNIYRHVDREQVQFDFMVHRPQEGFHDKEILSLGGKIYRTPAFNPAHHLAYKNGIIEVFKQHPEYKVLHAHSDLNGWPVKYAAQCGIPTRIAHSHNAESAVNLKYFFFKYEKQWIQRYCTDMFMCSTPAGIWSFGKDAVDTGKVKFIKNGIETERFRFDEKTRGEVRRELGAENKLVFCHIGRFSQQKNHRFLLKIFAAIHRKNPDTMLISAGKGELEDECKRLAYELGIADSVKFLGIRGDVDRLLQGADLFLLPSLWEGLPLTVVEAQTAGLPVVMSSEITDEVIITDAVKTRSVKDSPEHWAETALDLVKTHTRRDRQSDVASAGFDICSTAQFLQDFYIERTLHNSQR